MAATKEKKTRKKLLLTLLIKILSLLYRMLVFITSYYFSPCYYFPFTILFPDIPSLLFTVFFHSFTRFPPPFTINLPCFVASFEYTIASSFHRPYFFLRRYYIFRSESSLPVLFPFQFISLITILLPYSVYFY